MSDPRFAADYSAADLGGSVRIVDSRIAHDARPSTTSVATGCSRRARLTGGFPGARPCLACHPHPTGTRPVGSGGGMSDDCDTLINFDVSKAEVYMITDTPNASRYALSFTAGALLVREALVAASVYLRVHDWDVVRDQIEESNLLQSRTVSSGRRFAREVAQRLAVLGDDELEVLVDSTASERGHLLWAAACRRYALIGQFAEEVVRERFLLLASTLSYEDFDSFIRTHALWHEELAEIKDSTLRKLRSNVFRMLYEAELLSEAGYIVPAVLSERVIAVLSARTPSDLRFFPTQQTEGQVAAR